MTRPQADILRVAALLDDGMSESEAARRSGVPQRTVNKWARAGIRELADARRPRSLNEPCPAHRWLPRAPYAHLLGLYLGDGYLAAYPRGVYRLHITCCNQYPGIISECAKSMAAVLPNKVNQVARTGCVDVVSYSKHWSCLFPQHGAGRKHRRRIELEPWQETVALEEHPELLLRGLIQSDGWRGVNRIKGVDYPRYQFSNRSDDIRRIFEGACRRVGVGCTRNGPWQVSVSRRDDVAFMDTFIGPKR